MYHVSTSEEFINAVSEINAGDDGAEYVIEMLSDITLGRMDGSKSISLEFEKGITTIYGNGHVLKTDYSSETLIYAKGNSVINLGSADEPEKSKLFFNDSGVQTQYAEFLTITGSATVNIYDGVVLQNNSAMSRPGGAISVEGGTLNMYGGVIRNCKDTWNGYGGAVFVNEGAIFNMYGGTIEDNVAGKDRISSAYGGGVCNFGTFNMEGGVIQNNTATGSKDQSFGGGVCSVGTFNMTGGVIQNNTADVAADDIFSQGETNITVSANKDNGFGTLTSTNKQIKGWFEDGNNENGSRWNVNDYCIEITAEQASSSDGVTLKAAHGANVTVTFDTKTGVWNDTTDEFTEITPDKEYSKTLEPGATAGKPAEPTKEAYKFLGWFTKDGTEYDFNAEVNEDITLYAKWEYTGYLSSVIIDKTYLIAEGYTDAGKVFDPTGKLTENITLTIEAYKSFNREVGKDTIPAFGDIKYTFTTGENKNEIQINLPDFSESGVGDYWYKVTETQGSTAGVTYDPNEYYMHIGVAHSDELNPDGCGVSYVTFHKNAPNDDGTYTNLESDKTTGVTNIYGAGGLTVKVDVKGNFADRTKKFGVSVVFMAPSKDDNTRAAEGKTVTGDIFYADGTVAVPGNWNTSKEVELELGLNDTVTFTNIPDGVTYTVIEKDYSAEGYEIPVYTFEGAEDDDKVNADNDVWDSNNALGRISDDMDTVIIANGKNVTIDVGVILDNAPYVMIILFVISTAAVMFVKRRKASDAE